MKHLLFSIHDIKAGAYLPPFTLPNKNMAIRTFTDCVNDPNHAFCRNPADYTLFCLGEFDDNDGQITSTFIESCGNAVEFVKSKMEQ